MKLSTRLYQEARSLWDEAAKKDFLIWMAEGTLDESLFHNYMIQDYLYMMDYLDILRETLVRADDLELQSHLKEIIRETKNEITLVHLPALQKIGVDENAAKSRQKEKVITDYVAYMKNCLVQDGLLAGLTALLQCSWNYAYIAKAISARCSDMLPGSPYKSWFDAYTSAEYGDANQLWIDDLDKAAANIDEPEINKLCTIFKTCAEFENSFWDVLKVKTKGAPSFLQGKTEK